MNPEFPPLLIPQPRIETRRPEKGRPIPLSPEALAKRAEIAKRLRDQIAPLSQKLKDMSDKERRAVFYKLEHDGPVNLTGTGLKAVAEPSERFTLAVPTADDLTAFTEKLDQFEQAKPREGIVPNARLATAVETVQLGEPKDRLSQELLENYDALIKAEFLVCEIELLSLERGANQQRDELAEFRAALKSELDKDKGYGALFEQEEIKGTLRIVIRCTGPLFQKLVEDQEWQRRIYWFEARPEFETFHKTLEDFKVSNLGAIGGPPDNAPIICVIDSGVSAGNPFLKPVVKEELLKSFLQGQPDNPSDELGHGSGVASLAAYHSLNVAPGAENSGKVWIASARILTAENRLEDERLFSSLLREVVEYFAPHGIKIFNLSVNIRNLSWNRNAKRTHPRRSWVARTIDELSRKHDVVFVVSTGNIPMADVREFHGNGTPYPAYFSSDDACILDPGQAALALSVGSVAPTTLAEGQVAKARAIALRDNASPFTRRGPGIRKETKPELVDYGGNYLLDEEGGQVRANRALSVAIATHQLTPAIRHDSGTSFAAPRAAHKLALVQADLKELDVEPSADLLKAFLVNSAKYPLDEEELKALQGAVGNEHALNVLGYGMANEAMATACDPHSVLLFYQGTIEPDTIAFLNIPIPAKLNESGRSVKRLTVTASSSPEVQRWGLERYLGATLKWKVFRGDVSQDEVIAAMSTAEEEENEQSAAAAAAAAEDSEAPGELKFGFGVTRRSRGAIQHDVLEWNLHKAEYSVNHYTLAIAAYKNWPSAVGPVPFAVVVRLEETGRKTEIYSEVQNALIALEVETQV